jgi:hypothetical protein
MTDTPSQTARDDTAAINAYAARYGLDAGAGAADWRFLVEGDREHWREAADGKALAAVEKTPGRASWTTRALALEGNPDNPDDHAEIIGRWGSWLDDGQRAAEEAGAQAAIDARVAAIVKATDGDTVIVAFKDTVTAQEAEGLLDRWAEYGPEDASLVIVENVSAIRAGAPAVTVDALAAALDGREFLVTGVQSAPGNCMWLATPARPHDLAVQLLSAIDMRLTDDPKPGPQPAPELDVDRVFAEWWEAKGYDQGRRFDRFEMAYAFGAGAQAWSMVELDREPQPAPDLAAEITRLRAQVGAGDGIIRDVLESLCQRDGLPLESTVVPGEPARNYELADRLGVGHVFGLKPQSAASAAPEPATEDDRHDGPWASAHYGTPEELAVHAREESE